MHFTKLSMKKNSKIYSLGKGYSPFIYKNETGLIYSFPVTSGHVDLTFEFTISAQDLDILKSHEFRFKILYFVVFHEAQSTFGTGHPKPRKYTSEEFENTKNKVLYTSETELKSYIKQFSKDKNLGEKYFDTFFRIVF